MFIGAQQLQQNSKELCRISETAPSFEEISQSLNDLLMDSSADVAGVAAESVDELFTCATLSAEYQQMSTWCWVNIRVGCDVKLLVGGSSPVLVLILS